MRVFISGPISGYPAGNIGAFHEADEHLTGLGHTPVNPHALPVYHGDTPCPSGGDEGDVVRHTAPCYMRTDLAALLECDAIYLLDGWTRSKGAALEHRVAVAIGLTVYYQAHGPDVELTGAQKRALHHCPSCGHLIANHDGAGCITCTNDLSECDGLSPTIETTYQAVAALIAKTSNGL